MRYRLPVATLVLLAACSRATVATSPSPQAAPASAAVASDGTSCPVAPVPGDLVPTRDAYIAAWQGTDADAVSRFFLDDARVQTDDQTMSGRVAITSGWISEDIGKLSDLRLTPRSMSQAGSDVTESGVMTPKFRHQDGTVTDEGGRYTHVWSRQPDGSWRLREARLTRGAPAGCRAEDRTTARESAP